MLEEPRMPKKKKKKKQKLGNLPKQPTGVDIHTLSSMVVRGMEEEERRIKKALKNRVTIGGG